MIELARSLEQMEAIMLTACIAPACSNNPVVHAVAAHLAVPGNQLRGRTCLDAADLLGLPCETGVRLASVCELLHNASLVHDDLIDRAPDRRGHASTWSRYGDGVTICTGDLMLSAAFDLAVDAIAEGSSPDILKLMHQRTRDVILGEAAELSASTRVGLTLEDYEALARGKSSSLLSLSLELPLLAASRQKALPFAQRFAACFAVAYQIVDDLEDVAQDRRTNALNVVPVLSNSRGLHEEEAQAYAAGRAIALLEEAFAEAARLPSDCARILVRHAEAMMKSIRASTPIASMSLYG